MEDIRMEDCKRWREKKQFEPNKIDASDEAEKIITHTKNR